MPATCRFLFTRTTPIYYSGERIEGTIYLKIRKKLLLEAISLHFIGQCNVQWQEKSKNPCIDYTDDYGKIDNTISCRGMQLHHEDVEKLTEQIVLDAGTVEYNFQFTVPEHCPATSKHCCGEIVYQLNLILQRESTFNKIFTETIVVKSRLNLCKELKLNEQYIVDDTDGQFELSVPCTAYVPGQLITYHLTIGKYSTYKKIIINLLKRTTYKCQEPLEKTRQILEILDFNQIEKVAPAAAREIKINGNLHIPLMIPITTTTSTSTTNTTNKTCLINVTYFIEALLVYDKSKVMQKLCIPIMIGTQVLRRPSPSEEISLGKFCYDNLALTTSQRDESKLIYKLCHEIDDCDAATDTDSVSAEFVQNSRKTLDQITLLPLKEKVYFRNLSTMMCDI